MSKVPTEGTGRRHTDSIQDALRSESVSGTENLSTWIQYLGSQNGTESLFFLEAWLRGLRSFFDLRYIPLSEAERGDIVNRNFAPELRIVWQAVQLCERNTHEVARLGQPDMVEFEKFIKSQMRKRHVLDYHVNKALEQPTPLDTMVLLLQGMHDLRVLLDSLLGTPHIGSRLFLSIGRTYVRDLRSYRYIDMLLTQRFKPEFDRVDNSAVAEMLKRIGDDQARRNVSLLLLCLYRMQRYLRIVGTALSADRPMRHMLILFALVHEEMNYLSEFIKTRFLKGKANNPRLEKAAELVLYSLGSERQRVFETELLNLSQEPDASPIFTRVENGHGLLNHCFQTCIVNLMRAFDEDFDGRRVFPSMVEAHQKTQQVQQALWNLRSYLRDILEKKGDGDLNDIMHHLINFRESSLRLLMHKDWEEFERFCDVLVTTNTPIELRTQLRHLVSFLEHLVQEVSKRSVLKKANEPRPSKEPQEHEPHSDIAPAEWSR